MSRSPLRVGILGASFGGAVHAPAFAAHEDFQVVAIASPNNAAEVARLRNIPAAYSSLEAMLAEAKLDVLSIAAPPFAHYQAALAALKRGLHLVCEKPFTLTVAEAEELVSTAKTTGTACIIAHEFRFLPTRIALHELITNHHLGALREIELVQQGGFLCSESQRPRGWWFSREHGGGIAGAWLSHLIDAATWLAGRPPLTSSGLMRTAVPGRYDTQGSFTSDVADGAFALLDYGDGLIARLCADGTLQVEASTVAVHGSLRTAIASGTSIHAQQLFTIDAEEHAELEVRPIARPVLASIHESVPAFTAMLDAFSAAIEGQPHHAASFEDGLVTQRVLASIGYGS